MSTRKNLFLLAVLGTLAVSGTPGAAAQDHIYWANLNILSFDGTTIGRGNIDGTGVNDNFITGASGPCGIAANDTHLYWQNSGLATIGRADIDGTGVDQSFIDLDDQNCGVTLSDTHVYWGREFAVGRANLDGTGEQEIFVATPGSICGVAVDANYVYWSNGPPTNTIGRASLTSPGTPNQSFLTTASNSCGVAVNDTHIFWGNNSSIGRANLDGSSPNSTFIAGAPGYNPSTPVVDSTYIYWANAADAGDSIGRANLDGSGVNHDFITGLLGPVGVALDPAAPSNEFTLGKLKRNKKKRTAKLTVEVPGPGELDLSGKLVKPQRPAFRLRRATNAKPVAVAGAVKLLIKPKGKAKKKLKKKGKAKVKLTVTYTPTGGTAATQTKKVKLKKKLKA